MTAARYKALAAQARRVYLDTLVRGMTPRNPMSIQESYDPRVGKKTLPERLMMFDNKTGPSNP